MIRAQQSTTEDGTPNGMVGIGADGDYCGFFAACPASADTAVGMINEALDKAREEARRAGWKEVEGVMNRLAEEVAGRTSEDGSATVFARQVNLDDAQIITFRITRDANGVVLLMASGSADAVKAVSSKGLAEIIRSVGGLPAPEGYPC